LQLTTTTIIIITVMTVSRLQPHGYKIGGRDEGRMVVKILGRLFKKKRL
jgi:hypothetical protein